VFFSFRTLGSETFLKIAFSVTFIFPNAGIIPFGAFSLSNTSRRSTTLEILVSHYTPPHSCFFERTDPFLPYGYRAFGLLVIIDPLFHKLHTGDPPCPVLSPANPKRLSASLFVHPPPFTKTSRSECTSPFSIPLVYLRFLCISTDRLMFSFARLSHVPFCYKTS